MIEMFGRYPLDSIAETFICLARKLGCTDAQIITEAARRVETSTDERRRRLFAVALSKMQKGRA